MSVIKTTSEAIYHMHRVNLFTHDLTQGPLAGLVRRSTKRELGEAAKNVKIPWSLADVQLVSSRYCHVLATTPQFLVALAASTQFFTVCRYNDLSHVRWMHISSPRPTIMEIFFPKRKNDQFREGSKVALPDSAEAVPNLPELFRQWRAIRRSPQPSDFVFPDFKFGEARRGSTHLLPSQPLRYETYRSALALWFGETLGLDTEKFLELYGTKSGRSGGASATSQAGGDLATIKRQGAWESDAVNCYIFQDDSQRTNFVSFILQLKPKESTRRTDLDFR